MNDRQRQSRDAFVRADEGLEPSMERLIAATPGLVREAGRRRAAGTPFLDLLVPVAFRAIPRLAACAALLLAVAATLFLAGGTTGTVVTATVTDGALTIDGIDQLILTGQALAQDDPLLRAIAAGEGT